VNGVRTWYDDRGSGETLVLLHGGLTDSRDFGGNLDRLADRFRVLTPDRRGHGRTPDVPGPSTVELWAQDTIAFVEKVAGGPVLLAGYSAGAITALWTERDLAAVGCPALVMAADDDFVTLAHSVTPYRALRYGQLAIVPDTSHLLLHERPELCAAMIAEFLGTDPAPRMMPVTSCGG
jgi:pimeloyl-ACP methyl ester carboxylesterase